MGKQTGITYNCDACQRLINYPEEPVYEQVVTRFGGPGDEEIHRRYYCHECFLAEKEYAQSVEKCDEIRTLLAKIKEYIPQKQEL